MTRQRVFLSYSHRDEHILESLLPYLTTLQREGLVDLWSDRELKGGDRWPREISAALDEASIAVLLVSQEFLVSPFIRDEELPRILKRHLDGTLTVLPVYISPSTVASDRIVVQDAARGDRYFLLSEFQGFGAPDETLSELDPSEQQRRFLDLSARIRELATTEAVRRAPAAVGGREAHDARLRPGIHRIPFPRNRTFTGREWQLKRLHEELKSGKPAAVTQALAGLGGIGKTQLALEYCYRFGGEYKVVWWIRAEQKSTRLEDIATLGQALGLEPNGDADRMARATCEWLERHQDWLLVYDNAEHPDTIRDLLPRSSGGRVVITSRYPAWGALAKAVRLGVWTEDEAAAYLSKRTGRPNSPAASEIASALGHLPLALAQAAAYIDETGCGFDGYLSLLQARPTEMLMLRANSSDAEKVIATVWDIAFARVAESNRGAVDLLNLFAFLPPDRINRQTLIERADRLPPLLRATVEDPLVLDAAVGALRRYSLIDTTGTEFSVHRLVQAVVRARLDDDAHYRLLSETAKDLEGRDSEGESSASFHEESDTVAPEPAHVGAQGVDVSWRRVVYAGAFIALVGTLMILAFVNDIPLRSQPAPGENLSSSRQRSRVPASTTETNLALIRPGRAASDSEEEKGIRTTIERSMRHLSRTDYRRLSVDERGQYDTARRYVEQAESAMAARNWVYAQTLATKALTLASELESSTSP